jgi:hypothetical protein
MTNKNNSHAELSCPPLVWRGSASSCRRNKDIETSGALNHVEDGAESDSANSDHSE